MKPLLLIVDDDEELRSMMKWSLADDYDLLLAGDRPGALEIFRAHHPMITMLDLGLPPSPNEPVEGLAALGEILACDSLAKVIVVSGQGERANAIRAVGEGAYDFVCKPVQIDELKLILKRGTHVAQLEREYRQMRQVCQGGNFEGMLGTSPRMAEVFSAVRKVATSNAPVLLLGESGTGKEMVALAIHRRSARSQGPFVAINCGAIPENLLESELFGHEKGSFTGAHVQRQGRVEMAAGGTLFLDEIGELPPSLQVKILRFLQDGIIERVGGRKPIQGDARIIAATNLDLKQMLAQGKFREDLYYRLAVVVVRMPPLRERQNDIALLAQAFLARFADQGPNRTRGLRFHPEAMGALLRHAWPGNVRELENCVKRAVIMAEGRWITPQDLELAVSPQEPQPVSLREARESVERDVIQRALLKHRGKIAPAAAELGISRPTFYELMDKLGLKREDRTPAAD